MCALYHNLNIIHCLFRLLPLLLSAVHFISFQFTEEQFLLRDPASYDYHCSLLDGTLATEDSTTYGINYRSPLNQITGFHVAKSQLPQDVMHILLEGVLNLEIKLLLNAFVSIKKYFTIDILNERIQNFTYGKAEIIECAVDRAWCFFGVILDLLALRI